MLRVALTGGIATGKSHVLSRFAARGVPTIDADVIARDVVRPHQPAWTALRQRFGPDMFTPDGSLDRKSLAAQAFADPAARADLEAIVHPHVRAAIDEWFQQIQTGRHGYAVADIPLLFETRRAAHFDKVIVTACSPATQLARLAERDGLTTADGRRRLEAQLPTEVKTAGADFVIETEGTFEDTDRQVDAVHRALSHGVDGAAPVNADDASRPR